jgi:adenylate cyclase
MSTPMILNEKSQEDKMKGLATATNSLEVNPFGSLQDWNRHLIAKVGQQVALIERMNRLKRFLPPQIAETILNSDDANLFESHRREITAVFLDLRGFTAFSDSAEPEEVMALLKNYHGEMGKLILKFSGTLEHFAGDGMMVFFNDPIPCEDHAEKAVCMGLEMRDKAKELRTGWLKNGCDLDLGIGVAAGYAVVGNIGFEGRMDYAAVGNVTNLAARLCGAAKGGQILTNQRTLSKIENLVEAEPLEELHLKGFVRPVRAFNIVNLKPNGDSRERGC